MNKVLLLLPLLAIVVVSGCTTDIPFLSGLFGPQVVKYENDIVIIKSLDATPNTVFPGQTARLTAYIQNQGKKTLENVVVDLYDYCEGTFKLDSVICGTGASPEGSRCTIAKLYPYEIREIRWSLQANENIKLQTTCPADGVKVSVNYEQKTEGVSTIALIDEAEMQRQMSEGIYKEKQSYIVAGEGPIKGYITVEDRQPIPVNLNGKSGGSTVIGFQLKNEGNGFLAFQPGTDTKDKSPMVKITTFDAPNTDITGGGDCDKLRNPPSELKLILRESPKIVCTATIGNTEAIKKEMSRTMKFALDYFYEFRASTKITVMPKAITE